MSRVVELLCSRRVPHVAALALMSFGFAGCSADMQTRLSQNNLSNPFASQPETTSSVRDARGRAPRAAAIFPAAQSRNTSHSRCRRRSRRRSPIRPRSPACPGGGRGLVLLCAADASAARDHRPPSRRARSRRSARRRSTAQAGTTIIVGTSDTLETLSRRYNVSSAAILQANGYKGPRALSPGQQLIIPRQTAAVAAPAPAPRRRRPASLLLRCRADGSCRQSRRHACSASRVATT